MAGIVRRPLAENDLIDIWVYVAVDNEPAADRILNRLERAFAMLADNPFVGRGRSELASGLRSFPVGTYLVFYRPLTEKGIELVRVLSAYRDIAREDLD